MGAPPDIGSGAWFPSPCSNDIAECAQGLIDLDRLQMQKKTLTQWHHEGFPCFNRKFFPS